MPAYKGKSTSGQLNVYIFGKIDENVSEMRNPSLVK
jgi:hypothetical protein